MELDRILLDHGSGGILAHDLTKQLFLPAFNSSIFDDGAVIDLNAGRIAFSTDSYVVDPIFFPGGSIGDLAVNGTINDLSMCGAYPKYLSVGLIIEEGFSMIELEKIVHDMSIAARKVDVKVITGDTKVVPKGNADKIFINTTGIGIVPETVNLSSKFAKPGDAVILSGTIGDHGITIMTQRDGFHFDSSIRSDTAPLNSIVKRMIETHKTIHVLRDPTRGGVGTSLNEIAQESSVGIKIFEQKIPIKDEVASICNFLGFDPLYVANEGKLIAFVPKENVKEILLAMRSDKTGKDACVIGEVVDDHRGQVFMKTLIGGERIVGMLVGDQLPRIC